MAKRGVERQRSERAYREEQRLEVTPREGKKRSAKKRERAGERERERERGRAKKREREREEGSATGGGELRRGSREEEANKLAKLAWKVHAKEREK